MSERLLLAGAILLALLLAGLWVATRPRALTARLRRSHPVRLPSSDRPMVLVFTAPDCAAYHAAQRPALEALTARLGDHVEIREVDVLAFNVGFAPSQRLLAQLPTSTRNGGAAART